MSRRVYVPRIVGVVLLSFAVLSAWMGGAIMSLTFSGSQDSPDVAFLTVGGLFLVMSAMCAAAGLLVLSRRGRLWWLALAVASLIAAAVPYVSLVGSVGYALHVVLILMTIAAALAFGGVLRVPGESA